MIVESPLQFSQSSTRTAAGDPTIQDDMTLGVQLLGSLSVAAPDGLPLQYVAAPPLCGAGDLFEIWHGKEPVQVGTYHNIAFRRTESVLFGVIEIDESTLDLAPGTSTLLFAAERAYRQIFALLAEAGFPHLWRIWNYLPRIHDDEYGLERYRQFNIGRHQAFAAFERPVESSPAACALGVAQGPLSISFMAARSPSSRIENPRQVSAFAYPTQYGPRSPTFTRAATARNGTGEVLFISGTASIVGHQTLHHGDVAAQTHETVANLAALIEQANLANPSSPYALQDLIYRVYIRHAADYPTVKATFEAALGGDARAVYVQADICRRDLLVEIEALAFHSPKDTFQ